MPNKREEAIPRMCGFCLQNKTLQYDIQKTLQFDIGSRHYTTEIIHLMADLLAIDPHNLPKTACPVCIRFILQLQCFKIQSLEAIHLLRNNKTINFEEIAAIKKEINLQKVIWTKDILGLSNQTVLQYSITEEDTSTPTEPIIESQVINKKRPTRSKPKRSTTTTFAAKPPKAPIEAANKISTAVPEYSEEEILKRPSLCTICGFRFVRNDYLVIHMRRHKGEKPFKCKYCEKAFTRTTDLNVHERYHTNQRTHFCKTCHKGFYRPFNLEVHMRVHTKERPYKCPECPKSYGQSNDLKVHLRSKHTGERWICDVCGETFVMKHHLTKHKKMVHNLEVASNNGRLVKVRGDEK